MRVNNILKDAFLFPTSNWNRLIILAIITVFISFFEDLLSILVFQVVFI